jgi:hypothetical protein
MKIPKEALTLHIYQYEEVICAFKWAIITHNCREAVFWGLELYDSGMMEDIFEVLVSIWIEHIGFGKHCLTTLYDILGCQQSDELDRDTWIKHVYCWSNLRTMDSTAFQILVRGALISKTWTPYFKHATTYDSLDGALTDCLKRGKLLEGWSIARGISSDVVWKVIEEHCEALSRLQAFESIKALDVPDCLRRCACMILATISHATLVSSLEPLNATDIPSEIQSMVDDLDCELSLRRRRAFKIRPECIVDCARTVLPTNQSNFKDIEINLEENLKRSPCWQLILEEYMEPDYTWKSDFYKEMFYNSYFPHCVDDIPDEWSLKDKEQSHGRGLGKTAQLATYQYINNMLRNKTCIGVYYSIQQIICGPLNSLDWDSIYDQLHAECKAHLEAKLPMQPSKKVFELI